MIGQFWRHVLRRADEAGQLRQGSTVGQAGHPEIGQLHRCPAAGRVEEQVFRLDVPVNDAGGVHSGHTVQQLAGQAHRFRRRHRALVPKTAPQVLALDELRAIDPRSPTPHAQPPVINVDDP